MKEYLKESVIPNFVKAISHIDNEVIEDAMISLFKGNSDRNEQENDVVKEFLKLEIELDIEILIYIFEALLEKQSVVENGIVFTPEYIASFIAKNVMNDITEWNSDIKIIDPGCGCGIFLIQALRYIKETWNIKVKDIVKNHIFGIDLEVDNVRRCKKILKMLVELDGDEIDWTDIHILHADSLKNDWNRVFEEQVAKKDCECPLYISGFDYIIGNPPYVNTHDMSKETILFLKDTFQTIKSGVFNIFYAFIEHGMKYLKPNGKLSYIIPNNFLTIKSALELRVFIQNRMLLSEIIDFSDNMIFKPVRTYNCIIVLDNQKRDRFRYAVLNKSDDLIKDLQLIDFNTMSIKYLDKNGWNLVDRKTHDNLIKIESQFHSIKDFVRTGIATLKDDVYMVQLSEQGFCKEVNGIRYEIEENIVKIIYKIPELKKSANLKNVCRYIIFPYRKGEQGLEIIPEDILIKNYPKTYQYLVAMKKELDTRDKGKKNPIAWYAYGRTQGLTKYGRKLLFPTFSNLPKFMLIEDETALFCNGYGVFENEYLELEELMAVLNSTVMQYYVTNTSYAIEGGYFCYQKKYIEKFSIPWFDDNEKYTLRYGSKTEIDEMLVKKYDLVI